MTGMFSKHLDPDESNEYEIQASFCHSCGPLAGQCDQYCGYGACAASWQRPTKVSFLRG